MLEEEAVAALPPPRMIRTPEIFFERIELCALKAGLSDPDSASDSANYHDSGKGNHEDDFENGL